jgi:hypothetical protein
MPDLNAAEEDFGQSPSSPDNQAPSPTTPEKDEDRMQDDEGGETPCRVTRRTAKCSIIVSPTQEGPAAQCAKMDKPVSLVSFFRAGKLIPSP